MLDTASKFETRGSIAIREGADLYPDTFEGRFSRCRVLLHLVASRVLGGPEQAEEAVHHCHASASQEPHEFENEGAFRSWLVRILIDEALAILRHRKQSSDNVCSGEYSA